MDELRDFLVLLFREKEFNAVPDLQIDSRGFLKAVTKMVEQEAVSLECNQPPSPADYQCDEIKQGIRRRPQIIL
jgi:hypothetical protein